jgi:hypothetical protein
MTHITLGELLDRLDSPIDAHWWGFELTEEFGEDLNTSLSAHGFTAQPIFEWCCTDTLVGYHIIRLHGEPVCLSMKEARKSSASFSWFSEDAYWQVRNLIHQLARAEEHKPTVDLVNLDALVPTLYSVEYSSQLIHDEVLYQGARYEVAKRLNDYNRPTEQNLVLRGADGAERTVDVREVQVPTPLKSPTEEK